MAAWIFKCSRWKKADCWCTKAHTIWVCEEITLKGISGQRAMKWEIVQLWINELDPRFPLLISDITELWLYGQQMANEQNNEAVRNQTELEWLHFYSIRGDPKMHTGKRKTDHTPRSLLAKNEHKDDNKRKHSLLLRGTGEPFEWSGLRKTSK